MSFFTVPTVDGASVNWAADKVTLASGQMITGQDLDLDYVWYEKNPVLNFDLTSEAVYPDAFTVKFIGPAPVRTPLSARMTTSAARPWIWTTLGTVIILLWSSTPTESLHQQTPGLRSGRFSMPTAKRVLSRAQC